MKASFQLREKKNLPPFILEVYALSRPRSGVFLTPIRTTSAPVSSPPRIPGHGAESRSALLKRHQTSVVGNPREGIWRDGTLHRHRVGAWGGAQDPRTGA